MGLSNYILKLAFRRAFDGTVNSYTEKKLIYRVLAFFFRGNQKVCSSSSSCNVQFHLLMNYGVGPYIFTRKLGHC